MADPSPQLRMSLLPLTELTNFVYFPLLPQEIQNMVFILAINDLDARVVSVSCSSVLGKDPSKGGKKRRYLTLRPETRPTALFSVCYTSRTLAINARKYNGRDAPSIIREYQSAQSVYLNPKIDTLWMTGWTKYKTLLADPQRAIWWDGEEVPNIAFDFTELFKLIPTTANSLNWSSSDNLILTKLWGSFYAKGVTRVFLALGDEGYASLRDPVFIEPRMELSQYYKHLGNSDKEIELRECFDQLPDGTWADAIPFEWEAVANGICDGSGMIYEILSDEGKKIGAEAYDVDFEYDEENPEARLLQYVSELDPEDPHHRVFEKLQYLPTDPNYDWYRHYLYIWAFHPNHVWATGLRLRPRLQFCEVVSRQEFEASKGAWKDISVQPVQRDEYSPTCSDDISEEEWALKVLGPIEGGWKHGLDCMSIYKAKEKREKQARKAKEEDERRREDEDV